MSTTVPLERRFHMLDLDGCLSPESFRYYFYQVFTVDGRWGGTSKCHPCEHDTHVDMRAVTTSCPCFSSLPCSFAAYCAQVRRYP